jgi:uncharacterized protein
LAKYLVERGADRNLASAAGLAALYAPVDAEWTPHAWYPQPNVTQEKTSYLDLLKVLLDRGANPNVRLVKKVWFRGLAQDPTWVDPSGSTPFWRAAQSAAAAMKLLAAHGADPKIASNQGDTSLMVAAGVGWMANHSNNAPNGWLSAIQLCVELGVDVNAADSRGYTALHGAAYIGDNDAVKFLVSKGAKIDAKSKAGDTVVDMANGPTRFGLPHPETVALLESLGGVNSHNCRSDQCLVLVKQCGARSKTCKRRAGPWADRLVRYSGPRLAPGRPLRASSKTRCQHSWHVGPCRLTSAPPGRRGQPWNGPDD